MSQHHIYIDGQAGTTGLQITERLSKRSDLHVQYLNDSERKDPEARKAALRAADVAILCLPDAAAREAVELAAGETRILDASSAFRTDPTWAYGLPELAIDQRNQIRNARCVSNPGCYPQGFILMTRPLIESGLLPADQPLSCHAVSGYSGGGRSMVEEHKDYNEAAADRFCHQTYGLNLNHKHVPEMQYYSGTQQRVLFSPAVAHYYQGMLVHVPLFASALNGSVDSIHSTLTERYAHEPLINVLPQAELASLSYLNPVERNADNQIDIMVFTVPDQALLVARYDNLGKGAAGAAVQNLNIMLGQEELMGLEDNA